MDVQVVAGGLDIRDRGFGLVFLDHQQGNQRDYMRLTDALIDRFGVSRSAIRVRLKRLGLLREAEGSREGGWSRLGVE